MIPVTYREVQKLTLKYSILSLSIQLSSFILFLSFFLYLSFLCSCIFLILLLVIFVFFFWLLTYDRQRAIKTVRTRPLARPRIGFQTVAAAQIPYDHSVGTGSGSALWRLALVAPGFLHVFPRSLRDLAEAICCQITRKRVLSPGASSLVVLIGGERRCLDLIARGWIATGMACRWRGNNTSFFPTSHPLPSLPTPAPTFTLHGLC